jgi:hypothetical protein
MTDDLEAALDEALAERLDRFYGDILVAKTMRTPKAVEQWTGAAVQRAVADIKRLCREGAPPRTSPFKKTRRGLGVMQGEGQGGSGSGGELRLVE